MLIVPLSGCVSNVVDLTCCLSVFRYLVLADVAVSTWCTCEIVRKLFCVCQTCSRKGKFVQAVCYLKPRCLTVLAVI